VLRLIANPPVRKPFRVCCTVLPNPRSVPICNTSNCRHLPPGLACGPHPRLSAGSSRGIPMKKILIAAALVASTAVPSAAFAADAPAAATPKPVCYILPLLPDCLSAWKDESAAFWHKVTPAPKAAPKVAVVVPAAPTLPKLPACTKAAAGAGHLFDCKM